MLERAPKGTSLIRCLEGPLRTGAFLPYIGLGGRRLGGRYLLGFAQAHLYLHHLELTLGIEAFYVYLGGSYLALGLAGAELADGLGLVGGLADRLAGLLEGPAGVGEGDLGARVVRGAQGACPLVLLHQGGPLAHDVVVAALLVAEGPLHLLGVLARLLESGLYIDELRLGLLLLLDHLDGGVTLAATGELPGLALLDGEDLLLARGVVGEHLLVGHRAGRGHLQLLEVLELVLHGVLEQYLWVALLDPREKLPEKAADRPG